MRGRGGFTLIELMTTSALVGGAITVLAGLFLNLNQMQQLQEAKAVAGEQARLGMQQVIRELRQAGSSSLVSSSASAISYRVPVDLDGNGSAIDGAGQVEWSPTRTIALDVADQNEDGLRESQLILVSEHGVRVLANRLTVPDGENGDGGLTFEASDGGVHITIRVRARHDVGRSVTTRLSEFVIPRNS